MALWNVLLSILRFHKFLFSKGWPYCFFFQICCTCWGISFCNRKIEAVVARFGPLTRIHGSLKSDSAAMQQIWHLFRILTFFFHMKGITALQRKRTKVNITTFLPQTFPLRADAVTICCQNHPIARSWCSFYPTSEGDLEISKFNIELFSFFVSNLGLINLFSFHLHVLQCVSRRNSPNISEL